MVWNPLYFLKTPLQQTVVVVYFNREEEDGSRPTVASSDLSQLHLALQQVVLVYGTPKRLYNLHTCRDRRFFINQTFGFSQVHIALQTSYISI